MTKTKPIEEAEVRDLMERLTDISAEANRLAERFAKTTPRRLVKADMISATISASVNIGELARQMAVMAGRGRG